MKAVSINAWEIENNDGETLVFMTPEEFEFIQKYKEKTDKEIERLNNIIEKLEQENAVLKTQVVNKDKYSYGIRTGSEKE